jgi:A/G-specific adenine glycosylase
LLKWHRSHRRDYPWRSKSDPYRVVVTELMLVRTRADQVAQVWPDFFLAYPTLEALAQAPQHQVREALRPLGLEWRAIRIVAFAAAAVRETDWPSRLHALPGGGPYVAATLALVLDARGRLPIDVTIARAIARYWGIKPAGEARRDYAILAAAGSMGARSRTFFDAWLDLAAEVCRPTNPDCDNCPLNGCVYRDGPERSGRLTSRDRRGREFGEH